jgi:hypothetical protein
MPVTLPIVATSHTPEIDNKRSTKDLVMGGLQELTTQAGIIGLRAAVPGASAPAAAATQAVSERSSITL